MFSGIVEATGLVKDREQEGSNVHFLIAAPFVHELKIDQSISHNGACLTVVEIWPEAYKVTAIEETLHRTNLGSWKNGSVVNLERCLRLGDRLDGHMVQGHVDTAATCLSVEDLDGSWKYTFEYVPGPDHATVPKGSICVNGVSLTVVDSSRGRFSVCIIPYTYDNTNFVNLKAGDSVNIEFDVIGKYVMQYMHLNNSVH